MPKELPIKLGKEPLIEALFEVRFDGDSSISDIVPGAFFGSFGEGATIERLPAAEVPRPIREQDRNLKYAPNVSLHFERYMIAIGDHSLVVACKLPYPGWIEFRDTIKETLHKLERLKLVKSIERFSLKYVNIVPGTSFSDQLAKLRLSIALADRAVSDEKFSLRITFNEDDITHLIHIASGASGTLHHNNKEMSGVIVDVDSITITNNVALDGWWEQLSKNVDLLRDANRRWFFSCLTKEALKEMEPVYE